MKIKAMNAFLGDIKDLKNPDFIFEPKLDGFRALCYVNKQIRFISRNDKDLTNDYPELQSTKKHIKAKSCILDGEIVAYDKQGNPNFELLQQGYPVTFVVFDILMKNGKKLIDYPLLERKSILEKTVSNGTHIEKILFTDRGTALWKEIIKHGLEGVMSKRKNDKYYPGIRSKTWLKIKSLQTIDCVIVGYLTGKREISSLLLAVYKDSDLNYMGKVGTGFNQQTLSELSEKFKKIVNSKPTVPELSSKNIVWLKPKLVCEVSYLEVTKQEILRSPVFMRLRTDKKPRECTFKDQIRKKGRR